jgi:hypothetical protein
MAWDYFLNQADADAYFTVERLVTTDWDALNAANKEKCVNFAYNRMFYDPTYSLPTLANATAAQLVVLRKATGELAYYVAQHLDDEDRRKGIQAQGVEEAGIVQEVYNEDMLMTLPYPPIVLAWLLPFKADRPIFKTDIDRDEDESVDENVTDF